jgi:hypothetical protein
MDGLPEDGGLSQGEEIGVIDALYLVMAGLCLRIDWRGGQGLGWDDC